MTFMPEAETKNIEKYLRTNKLTIIHTNGSRKIANSMSTNVEMVMLRLFLDVEEALDDTSSNVISRAICCCIYCLMKNQVIYSTLLEDTLSIWVAK